MIDEKRKKKLDKYLADNVNITYDDVDEKSKN